MRLPGERLVLAGFLKGNGADRHDRRDSGEANMAVHLGVTVLEGHYEASLSFSQ